MKKYDAGTIAFHYVVLNYLYSGLNMQHCSVKERQIGVCLYYVKKQYIPEKKQFSSLKRGFHTEHLEAEASMIPVTINNAIANP